MKYIWEESDIVAGTEVSRWHSVRYTIVAVDIKDTEDTGFALLQNNRVGVTYSAEEMADLLTRCEFMLVKAV